MPEITQNALRNQHDLELTTAQIDWLHQLIADWQLVADLSTSDLVLWARTNTGRFRAIDQCRPSSGATVHLEDVIGHRMPASREAIATETLFTGQMQESSEPYWSGTTAINEEYIPVVFQGQPIAVMTRESSVGLMRGGRIADKEQVALADFLCDMILRGEFPIASTPTGLRHGTPRVSDGVLRLDADGYVTYISPNARSCFHRLGLVGSLEGSQLTEAVTAIIPERTFVDEGMGLVLMGRQAWITELEINGVYLALRSVPLRIADERAGAIVLVRDISEIRRREQALLTKDATIREIHHRVKNNLQTVSALLRMQARRATTEETRAALAEAERRVATSATVHEALSQNIDEQVDFDELFGQILRMAAAVATSTGEVRTKLEGSFGIVVADEAQALATVLAELVANAVEHGFGENGGTVTVRALRDGENLEVHVCDDGEGLPEGTSLEGLGTQIVRTLVRGELRGSIVWRSVAEGTGTDAMITAKLTVKS